MKQTERLSLSLFEGSDNFDFAILNENFRKLEEALKNGFGAVSDAQIKNAVAEYLRNNPVVSGSATDKIIYVEVLAENWEPHPNGTGYYQIVATEEISEYGHSSVDHRAGGDLHGKSIDIQNRDPQWCSLDHRCWRTS